jgi:hypothetical protein
MNEVVSVSCCKTSNDWMAMSNELERMWKGAIMTS